MRRSFPRRPLKKTNSSANWAQPVGHWNRIALELITRDIELIERRSASMMSNRWGGPVRVERQSLCTAGIEVSEDAECKEGN